MVWIGGPNALPPLLSKERDRERERERERERGREKEKEGKGKGKRRERPGQKIEREKMEKREKKTF